MKYTLIIAEKPNASQKIASALSEGKPKIHETKEGVKYYEFTRSKKKYIVVPAVGHLYTLKDTTKGWNYPVFDHKWMPTFEVNKNAFFAKKYFDTIKSLVGGASDFIVATDYDQEGSVIGYNILHFLCNKNDSKRMKFSTLTKPDLVDSFENMNKHIEKPRVESGKARHELDFLYGLNTTRALTLAIKKGGKKLNFYLLSAGRVQAPMLHFLMQKENQIKAFKPKPYWEITAETKLSPKLEVTLMHEDGKIKDHVKATKALEKAKKAKKGKVVAVATKQYKQNPPVPFDLTTLQTEGYRFFGWSPRQTVNTAQSLYEKGFISYPRTSSQKLPPQIGYQNIFDALRKIKTYSKLVQKLEDAATINNTPLLPKEGKKTDAAHPAIYPTSETPDLKRMNARQKKLYDLIVRRFLSVFGTHATRESMKITFDLNGEKFNVTGRRTIEKGWTEQYGRFAKSDEVKFPLVNEGDQFNVENVKKHDKETSPPPRYSQGSILKELEKHNIGTKTTRGQILQTLYDRGYVQGKSIEVTTLGMKVALALEKYVPDMISEDLTRKFEKDMEGIEKGKRKREKVVKDAEKVLKKIAEEFRKNETKIGRELEKAILETKEEQSYLGACPNCEGGELKILFSPLTKKRFVGCSNYNKCIECGFSRTACKCKCPVCGQPKGKCKCDWKDKNWTPTCGTGFPLPLQGSITNTGAMCEKCNTTIIQCWRKGKRPFRMCLDPKCETKKDWAKPGDKKKEKGKKEESKKVVKKKSVKKKATKKKTTKKKVTKKKTTKKKAVKKKATKKKK